MLKMLKNKVAMMMQSGFETPLLFIGLALGAFLLIAINHWTGSNICAMWAPKAAKVVAATATGAFIW